MGNRVSIGALVHRQHPSVVVAGMHTRFIESPKKMPITPDHQTGHDHPAKNAMPPQAAAPSGAATAIDPVCGMKVTLKPDTRSEPNVDQTFHFCSEKCQTKFKAGPWFFASGNAAKRGKVAAVGVQYTCPMHPQIIRDAPGSCPICGMALEPILPSDAPSEEVTDFTRRMWISAAVAVPLVVLTMGPLVGLPVRDWVGHQDAM